MRKYLLNVLGLGCLLLLVGCQSTTTVGNLFTPTPSGPGLAQAVQDELMRNPDPVIAQVQVVTQRNVVILSGYVKKIRQSDVAEQMARNVPGVQTVENHIIVRQ